MQVVGKGSLKTNTSQSQRMQTGRVTFPLREPDVVCQEVGRLMVHAVDQLQDDVRKPDCVVVPVQDPLVGVYAQSLVGPEGR